MKTAIFENRALAEKLRSKGRKTKSHGSFRAKRHPNSPRVKNA